MKVAILSPYPTFPFQSELGCAAISYENNATWTVALADHLAKLPATEVHVLTESTDIARSQTITRDGVSVHYLKAPERFKTLSFWQLDRRRLHAALHDIHPDLVHGEGLENQYGYAAVTCRYPHVLTIHGIPRLANVSLGFRSWSGQGFYGWILEHFERLCLDRARNLIVINPFVAECYRLNAERYRLFSIPNAIGPHFFSAPPQPRAPATLLTVGAIDRRKAHDVLLRAVARL